MKHLRFIAVGFVHLIIVGSIFGGLLALLVNFPVVTGCILVLTCLIGLCWVVGYDGF